MIARWSACPCVTKVPVNDLQRATILAAEAVDSEGNRGDSVVALGAGGGSFSGSVKVELVELPVTVLDPGGAPVTGIEADKFTILEDDQPVTIEGFGTTADLPLSLALAVASITLLTSGLVAEPLVE